MEKKRKKILVAEDEEAMAQALSYALTDAGFEVDVVHDGQAALKKLAKKSFDLLVLDIVMPRSSGFAVLKKLKKQRAGLPIIVLTNLSQEGDVHRAKKLGANKVLIKSAVALEQITKEVKQLIG